MTKKVDVLQHVLVPAYRVLGEDEISTLLKKFNINVSQLPRMFVSDPISKHLKVKIGDVLEITRKSSTKGTARHYRVIVDG